MHEEHTNLLGRELFKRARAERKQKQCTLAESENAIAIMCPYCPSDALPLHTALPPETGRATGGADVVRISVAK